MYYFYYMELIVAKNNKNAIGRNGGLMWYLSKDLQRFCQLTQHQIIIMGRKTFESLPNGPLKNRIHVIITRYPINFNQYMKNVYFVSLEESLVLLMKLQKEYQKKVFIIGGSDIYEYFYPDCCILHITEVDDDEEGDTYFPISNEQIEKECIITCKETHWDKKTNIRYSFCTYQKK